MSMRNDRARGWCAGPSRREVLRAGVLTGLGLSLDGWFRHRAVAGESADPRAPVGRSCILVWLAGGASHIDTFDPKPEAPAEYRGEFKTIDTAIPAVQISELFPRMARILDRMVLIRSLTSPEADHDRATQHMLTGYRPSPALTYPAYGSVVARLHDEEAAALPPYVAVPEPPAFVASGYLTSAFDPFEVGGDPNTPGFRVRNLTPPDQLTLERLQRRRAIMDRLDRSARVPETPLTASRDRFTAQAYDILTSEAAQGAFRLDRESDRIRDQYGRSTLGQSCLLARRLIEAGVRFVTVTDGGEGQLGWDTHISNFPALRDNLAPRLDQALSALIEDLQERRLLDETLVLVMGEFGRTPRINLNGGRDHHGRASSVLLSGGGLRCGQVIGRTDHRADTPVDRPVTPADLAATVYQALGIDPSQKLLTTDGQPIRLVDTGQALSELL